MDMPSAWQMSRRCGSAVASGRERERATSAATINGGAIDEAQLGEIQHCVLLICACEANEVIEDLGDAKGSQRRIANIEQCPASGGATGL